jgi:NADH-quinone oxidoreductase subunit H
MENFAGPGIFLIKVSLLVFFVIWIRWTWPRLREDQLQSMAWRWLIPLALFNIALVSVFKVVL